jgi:hypothetical protein
MLREGCPLDVYLRSNPKLKRFGPLGLMKNLGDYFIPVWLREGGRRVARSEPVRWAW